MCRGHKAGGATAETPCNGVTAGANDRKCCLTPFVDSFAPCEHAAPTWRRRVAARHGRRAGDPPTAGQRHIAAWHHRRLAGSAPRDGIPSSRRHIIAACLWPALPVLKGQPQKLMQKPSCPSCTSWWNCRDCLRRTAACLQPDCRCPSCGSCRSWQESAAARGTPFRGYKNAAFSWCLCVFVANNRCAATTERGPPLPGGQRSAVAGPATIRGGGSGRLRSAPAATIAAAARVPAIDARQQPI